MYKNTPVIDFEAEPEKETIGKITILNEDFLPISLKTELKTKEQIDNITLYRWLQKRQFPMSRRYAQEIEKLVTGKISNSRHSLYFLSMTKALSLNDCFWLKNQDKDTQIWENVSLYRNSFSKAFYQVSFLGGSTEIAGNLSTPEGTTTGVLGKCWRKYGEKIYLYKRGNDFWASNVGYEPINEVIASKILKKINTAYSLPFVNYEFPKYSQKWCTRCELFTSEDWSFVSAEDWLGFSEVNDDGWSDIKKIANIYPEKYRNEFWRMIIFDYLIANIDRHLNNFGFLYNYQTKELKPAPIFDNGFSFQNIFNDDFDEIGKLGNLKENLKIATDFCGDNWYKILKNSSFFTIPLQKELRKANSENIINAVHGSIENLAKKYNTGISERLKNI